MVKLEYNRNDSHLPGPLARLRLCSLSRFRGFRRFRRFRRRDGWREMDGWSRAEQVLKMPGAAKVEMVVVL